MMTQAISPPSTSTDAIMEDLRDSNSCIYNYVVTAYKSSSVFQALKGNVTSPSKLNLILGKGTRIEIYNISENGLSLFKEFPIYGKIATMELFRPKDRDTDLIYFTTEAYDVCILEYNSNTQTLETRFSQEFKSSIRRSEIGILTAIDPDNRLIGLHFNQGFFRVLPLETGSTLKSLNWKKQTETSNLRSTRSAKGKERVKVPSLGDVRRPLCLKMKELSVEAISFLYGTEKPTLCVLYKDTKDSRHVSTHIIDMTNDGLLEDGPFKQKNVDPTSSILVSAPKPFGGVIILGQNSISYLCANVEPKCIPMLPPSDIKAHGIIGLSSDKNTYNFRVLFGDMSGTLYLLSLIKTLQDIDLKVDRIGETTIPSQIVYLDNGYAYIGCHFGDSQLIHISEKCNEEGSYVKTVENFTGIGPVLDFCVVDLEKQGQGQIIACAGAYKEGAIRIIRNGIGIQEETYIEQFGLKGIWSLKSFHNPNFHDRLIVSFICETRVLQILNDMAAIEEVELPGLVVNEPTIYAGNVDDSLFIQVCPSGIRLIRSGDGALITSWSPPKDCKIFLSAFDTNYLLISINGGILVLFRIEKGLLHEERQISLDHEVSSVDIKISEIDQPLCAVGLWTESTVRLMTIPDFRELSSRSFEIGNVPRSLKLFCFENINYLFVAMGDGILHVLTLMNGKMIMKKNVPLGTRPINLTPFWSKGKSYLFASSDRPTVIYSNNQKLFFSNVNLKDVTHMAPFYFPQSPNSLAFINENSLCVGSIDNIQKLHMRTIRLGETARRITYQESTKSFGVLTLRDQLSGDACQQLISTFRILDQQTYESICQFEFPANELAESIVSLYFENDPHEYYVVGTAFPEVDKEEPDKGRICVFQLKDKVLNMLTSLEVDGAVFCLSALVGKIAAGIKNKLRIYKFSNTGMDGTLMNHPSLLIPLCGFNSHINVLQIRCREDHILIGDMMRSITLLRYKAEDQLEELSRDCNTSWMTGICILDDTVFLGAENETNLFTAKYNEGTDINSKSMEIVGLFHLGELVNQFRIGSLMMNTGDSDSMCEQMVLFGTVLGSFGVIAQISKEKYEILHRIEQCLIPLIPSIGNLSHKDWRSFKSHRRRSDASHFIDGDVVELLLDFSLEKVEQLCLNIEERFSIKHEPEELLSLVEELNRIH